MLTLAKILVMLVRFTAVLAIIFGILLLTGTTDYLRFHIGIGFFLTGLVVILAVIALTRGAVSLGIVGIVFAFLLPYVGLKQFPLRFGAHLGWIQISHIVIALGTLALAEMMYGRIRRSAELR